MLLFKSSPSNLMINGKQIELKSELKYLGLIIDKRLNWLKHLNHIEQKNNQLMSRLIRMNWMNQNIELKYKLVIYKNVFLSTIMYGAKIWKEDLSKSTYKLLLRRVQSKFIHLMTGAYVCTSRERLQKFIGIIDIIEEVEIHVKSIELDKLDRKTFKFNERNRILNEMKSFDMSYPNVEQIRSRFIFWIVSNTGPFKSFLFNTLKIGDDDQCRFCKMCIETSSHLLKCDYLNLNQLDLDDEQYAKKLIVQLYDNYT